jgi:hypothetical protein
MDRRVPQVGARRAVSEYQYYEFRAVDRSLTRSQIEELRAISTRAVISPTSFSNYYTFGALKANPRDLLAKYFDASLYFANWLFVEMAFRYPKGAVDAKALRRYAAGNTIDVRSTRRDVIVAISVESDGDSFDTADDGSSWLSSLIGLRADLAGGDERILYFGWLLDVQCGEIDDDVVEPARPEGLGNLNPVLESFIDIFGIDRDLVAAAAVGAPKSAPRPVGQDVDRWLATLDAAEHLTMLKRVARGDSGVGAEIVQRFRRGSRGRATSLPLRTAGELRARAEAIAERRREIARKREARERAARERQEQAARDRYLTRLVKEERQTWRRIDALIGTRRPADYTAAIALLLDLRDVSRRKDRHTEFARRVGSLREGHAKKPSLLLRLRKAGL